MERLRRTEAAGSHDSTEEQLPLWPSLQFEETKTSSELLAPREWIEENSLRPDVAQHGYPVDIRKLINEGVKPKDIIVISLGR